MEVAVGLSGATQGRANSSGSSMEKALPRLKAAPSVIKPFHALPVGFGPVQKVETCTKKPCARAFLHG